MPGPALVLPGPSRRRAAVASPPPQDWQPGWAPVPPPHSLDWIPSFPWAPTPPGQPHPASSLLEWWRSVSGKQGGRGRGGRLKSHRMATGVFGLFRRTARSGLERDGRTMYSYVNSKTRHEKQSLLSAPRMLSIPGNQIVMACIVLQLQHRRDTHKRKQKSQTQMEYDGRLHCVD